MDKASILADAIEYVENLKQQVERAESDILSTNVSPTQSTDHPRVEETDSFTVRLDAANKYGYDHKYHVQVCFLFRLALDQTQAHIKPNFHCYSIIKPSTAVVSRSNDMDAKPTAKL